jgi:hypothetical protein
VTQAATPTACATPFSTRSLEAALPEWLDRSLIEDDIFYLPARLPDGCSFTLKRAADQFARAIDQRCTHQERTSILGELRLRTLPRDESRDEAIGRFRLLRDDLREQPTDVLREAVEAYAAENKFFPAGAGELLPYCRAISGRRHRIRWRLDQLAKEAEKREADERRRREDPLTPDEARAIIERHCPWVREERAEREVVRHEGPPRVPTRDDYIALGVDPAVLDRP